MSQVKVQGNASGTGIFTIESPNSNSNVTLTLPTTAGTILTTGTAGVPVNGPAFSAYRSGSAQNVTTGTWTKAQLNTEDFDTAGAFDNTTNYRFQPAVAGYYQITGSIAPDSTSSFGNGVFVAIYKNGVLYRASASYNISAQLASVPSVATLVYLNGSSDYIELYGNFVGGAGMQFTANYNSTAMSGVLVRSA